MTSKKRELKVSSNKSKRTFTIRIYDDCGITKYKTLIMNKNEFEENENNTISDWENFLLSDHYCLITKNKKK
jgi:hypothetical protein